MTYPPFDLDLALLKVVQGQGHSTNPMKLPLCCYLWHCRDMSLKHCSYENMKLCENIELQCSLIWVRSKVMLQIIDSLTVLYTVTDNDMPMHFVKGYQSIKLLTDFRKKDGRYWHSQASPNFILIQVYFWLPDSSLNCLLDEGYFSLCRNTYM